MIRPLRTMHPFLGAFSPTLAQGDRRKRTRSYCRGSRKTRQDDDCFVKNLHTDPVLPDYIFKGESGQVISQDVSLNVEFKCDGRQLATIGTTYREVFTMARSGTGGPDTHQVGVAALLRQVKDHVCGDGVGAGCKEVTFSGTQTFSVFANPTLNNPGLISPFGGFSYTGSASSNIGGPGISDYPPNDWPPSVKPTDLTANGGELEIGITHEFSGTIDPCKCTGKMTKHPAHDNYK